MKLNQIVMALVALVASALTAKKEDDSQVTSLKAEVDRLHSQLDSVGEPLTPEQQDQVNQLLAAVHAATPDEAVPAPSTVTVATAVLEGETPLVVATDKGVIPCPMTPVVAQDSAPAPAPASAGDSAPPAAQS